MLKFKLNNPNGNYFIEVKGTVDEVTADCIIIIHAIYKRICEENEDVGEVFRETLTDMVDNGFAFTAGEDDILEELLNQLTKGDKE